MVSQGEQATWVKLSALKITCGCEALVDQRHKLTKVSRIGLARQGCCLDCGCMVSQGEQATWVKLSAIKSNCGIELCLDECLKQLEAEDKAARKAEAARRQQAGLRPSKAAEEGAAAIGPDHADAHKDNAPVSASDEDVDATLGECCELA